MSGIYRWARRGFPQKSRPLVSYMARMAKGKRGKQEPAAEVSAGKSLLDVAWKAYQAGDVVLARRASKLLLAGAAKDADETLAKKLGKEFFAAGHVADARQVAAELVMRTQPPLKPFILAGAAALIWLVLLAIASRG